MVYGGLMRGKSDSLVLMGCLLQLNVQVIDLALKLNVFLSQTLQLAL